MNRMTIIGWKHSKGDYNGNAYDYAVLYAVTKMEQKENQRGSAGIDVRGDSSLVEQLQKLDFSKGALDLNIEIESRAVGKGQFVNTAVSIQPISK